jgi:transposase
VIARSPAGLASILKALGLSSMLDTLDTLDARLAEATAGTLGHAEAELAVWAGKPPPGEAVARLGCYRGIAELNGLTLAAEVAGWRRFPAARAFMCFTGLVPTEYSSGERTRLGSITKAGSEPVRTALIEAAWSYLFRPAIGATLHRRQHGADPDTLGSFLAGAAAAARRYEAMTARGKPAGVAVTVMAREFAGFVWTEMTS